MESRTNSAALTSKTLFLGMPEEEALRRIQSAGGSETEMESIPIIRGWFVSGARSTLVLSFTNRALASITVEENSDQPKVYRKFYTIDAYSLP